MTPEQRAELRRIEDEAIAKHRDKRGRVDHVAAAGHRRDELVSLEAGGHIWAATVRDAAEMNGHRQAIAHRLKATSVAIPAPTGAVTVPSSYSVKREDGGTQMSLWLHIPLDELAAKVSALLHRSVTLNDRALAMRYGLELAIKHGMDTAAEGFKAEGIDLAEEA